MEFHLLPVNRGNPATPGIKTPYVAVERYDGGPFLTYPERRGKATGAFDGTTLNLLEYLRVGRVHPVPLDDQESFIQTWLYFGLIAEFTCCNASDESTKLPNPLVNSIYDKLVTNIDGKPYVQLDAACLHSLLAEEGDRWPDNVDEISALLNHLIRCLNYTHPIVTKGHVDLDPAIRWSICAMGDFITMFVNYAFETLKIPTRFERDWGIGILDPRSKALMRGHGWCPSDISRIESKFQRVQTFYLARMMDKSLPRRDHSRCTSSSCNAYLVNSGEGISQHKQAICDGSCQELVVDVEDLTPALFTDAQFPLLKLKGGINDLDYEIVGSDHEEYIAISHVWADGLGNPNANSLHRCKLFHLRGLVEAVHTGQEDLAASEPPLIWLDTLCSPAAEGPAKTKAIEKIRLVYRSAKHVLVLDAGLMSYEARTQHHDEILVRIFTCGWMRRLWTLQEGALARSLYFQFADRAVSLTDLMSSLAGMSGSMMHRAVYYDMLHEKRGLDSFFGEPQPGLDVQTIHFLDRSLQYRGVTVPSDEPLCIATLLSLDLATVLQHSTQGDRMQEVWRLIPTGMGGIPSSIIFLEEPTLRTKGWRWAPKSLLTPNYGLLALNTRLARWDDPQLVAPTASGLRVSYPGYRVSLRRGYDDGLPRNPWPGLPRLAEEMVHFHDAADSRTWYRMVGSRYAAVSKLWTEKQQQEHRDLAQFPLHDTLDTGEAVVICNGKTDDGSDVVAEALLGIVNDSEDSHDGGIAVSTSHHVIIWELGDEGGYFYDVIKAVAMSLRASELTETHVALFKKKDESATDPWRSLEEVKKEFASELAESKQALRDKMKEMVAAKLQHDQRFLDAVDASWGEALRDYVWVAVQDFFNHDYVGEKLRDDQVWFVD